MRYINSLILKFKMIRKISVSYVISHAKVYVENFIGNVHVIFNFICEIRYENKDLSHVITLT